MNFQISPFFSQAPSYCLLCRGHWASETHLYSKHEGCRIAVMEGLLGCQHKGQPQMVPPTAHPAHGCLSQPLLLPRGHHNMQVGIGGTGGQSELFSNLKGPCLVKDSPCLPITSGVVFCKGNKEVGPACIPLWSCIYFLCALVGASGMKSRGMGRLDVLGTEHTQQQGGGAISGRDTSHPNLLQVGSGVPLLCLDSHHSQPPTSSYECYSPVVTGVVPRAPFLYRGHQTETAAMISCPFPPLQGGKGHEQLTWPHDNLGQRVTASPLRQRTFNWCIMAEPGLLLPKPHVRTAHLHSCQLMPSSFRQ
nr:PREDICTED: uncharacterized protein LOC103548118 [Equus przewalskii]